MAVPLRLGPGVLKSLQYEAKSLPVGVKSRLALLHSLLGNNDDGCRINWLSISENLNKAISTSSLRQSETDSADESQNKYSMVDTIIHSLPSQQKRLTYPLYQILLSTNTQETTLFKEIQGEYSAEEGYQRFCGILDKIVLKVSLDREDIIEALSCLSCLDSDLVVLLSANPNLFAFWNAVDEMLSRFSDAQLKLCLEQLGNIKIEIPRTLLDTLDNECSKRTMSRSWSHIIYLLDFWYRFPKRPKEFLERIEKKVIEEYTTLNPPLVIQLLYFLGHYRFGSNDLFEKLEHILLQGIDEMNIKETMLVCRRYYDCRKKIYSKELLKAICGKGIENLTQTENYILCNILKLLRLSEFKNITFQQELIEQLTLKTVTPSNFLNISYFSLSLLDVGTYNKTLLNMFIGQTIDELQKEGGHLQEYVHSLAIHGSNLAKIITFVHPSVISRTKDLARFLKVMAYFNHYPEDASFFGEVEKKLRDRLKWKDDYPYFTIECLFYLSVFGIYLEDILSSILEPKLIDILETWYRDTDNKILWKVWVLNSSLDIECPHYSGNRLFTTKENEWSTAFYKEYYPYGFNEMLQTLKELHEGKYIASFPIIPHFSAVDIELLTDDSSKQPSFITKQRRGYLSLTKASTLPESLSTSELSNQLESNSDVITESESRQRIAIQILDDSLCAKDSDHMLGTANMKIRQLQKLDYLVLTILPSEVKHFMELSSGERKKFLKNKLTELF